MVDFSQYCTVLAEPAARSQIALIDTRGAHPTLALGNKSPITIKLFSFGYETELSEFFDT